ncbi:MAG: polysaccharide lyase family 8 super-sandwich domain-containing protein, partial [Rikenellaceae bacterium]
AIKNFIDRNFISPESENRFVGNKHFSNSDLTIHRTKNWMASLRMASMRVIGTEQINEDNLKGYYMADGAIYIYSRGDDYHNIFPFWDWRRIPGITTYKSDDVIPIANSRKAMNHTFNVGGVSDCSCGITAMELNRNGLKGYKSWIFTDDFVFCMGSGIESDSTSGIITSIDQRFSRGKIYDCGSGRFFHDNMGYIILQADSSVCRSEKREGRWCDIMGMYAPQKLESEIFSLYIEHKINKPSSYLYLMLPASTKESVENFDLSAINIVRNDKKAQVAIVRNRCYIAAYQPIDVSLGGLSISIIKPGTYIANATNGEIISAAPFVIETASE